MANHFLQSADGVQWLRDTHLRGVTLPTDWQQFQSAIVQGNEDAPYAVNLYRETDPHYQADYLRVMFDHGAPIYCEFAVYDGKTDKPREARDNG